jgi:uncharacterized protein (DUF58 family)
MSRNTLRSYPFFLTSRFYYVFGVASLLMCALYLVLPFGWYVYTLIDFAILAGAAADYFLAPAGRLFSVTRPIPYPLAVGKPNDITLLVANKTGRNQQLILYDDLPEKCQSFDLPVKATVPPTGSKSLKYRVTPLVRGLEEFGDIHYWYLCPLGLVWKHGESDATAQTKMYPGLALIERRKLRVHRYSSDYFVRPTLMRGEGSEFDSLRDYVPGDDPRLINWAATARKGRPIIRQNRMERSQNVFVVLDIGRMMTARVSGRTKLDYAIDSALMMAYGALSLGDKVGLMAVGQEVSCFIPPSKKGGQFGYILDTVYALEAQMQEPRFYQALSDLSLKLKRRSLVVIFTDLIDERASEGLKRYILALQPRHLPLVVAMSDTEIIKQADIVPEREKDVYRQAVASEMLDRRDKLLAKLSAQGVLILDTPPENISNAALDKYLEIKTRNLL